MAHHQSKNYYIVLLGMQNSYRGSHAFRVRVALNYCCISCVLQLHELFALRAKAADARRRCETADRQLHTPALRFSVFSSTLTGASHPANKSLPTTRAKAVFCNSGWC
jgi:hypothetical protein